MSDLFSARVEAVAGDTARIRFEVCHPDQWNVPDTKNFALQAVVDAYWNMKMGYVLGDRQPASRGALKQRAADHPQRGLLEEWLELAHGRNVAITEAEYERLARDGFGNEPVAGLHYNPSGWYKSYGTQYAAFRAAAERAIISVELEDQEGNPKHELEDPDPKATIVLRVAEPGCLDHLVPGFTWATAIFDFTGW
jgi:hypothetical protein